MLTGGIKKPEDIPEGDFRKTLPRFAKENFDNNLELVRQLQKIAEEKGCSPAQLAIGWVKHLSKKDGNPEIIPIPGATTAARVEENAKDVLLSSSELSKIDSILKKFEVAGDRYSVQGMAHAEG
jgi:pyridoxine 4-dehydrogenase